MEYNIFKGDCLELMQSIPDGSIDAVITDPPYGTTNCKWDSVIPFAEMWEQLNRVIKPNGAVVLFGSEPFSSALRMSNIKAYKYDWVWDKKMVTGIANAKKQPLRCIELISVFYKKQPIYNPQKRQVKKPFGKINNNKTLSTGNLTNKGSRGVGYPKNLIHFARPNNLSKKDPSGFHPTQKPVPLMEYLIKTYTNEGETVLDFTMGSGTTGVACGNLNRKFYGIEQDDKYFEIAETRIHSAYNPKQTKLF